MTFGVTWERGQGDTGPPLAAQLLHPPTYYQLAGEPVDVSGASSIIGVVERRSDRAVVHEAEVAVIDPASGKVELALEPTVTAAEGLHAVQFVVTWPNNRQQRFPAAIGQEFNYLLVRRQLVSQTVPIMPSAPPPGADVVTEPALFVSDSGTGLVTGNGQHVFAGASSTINLDTGVTVFTIAQHPDQTAWGSGTTPTGSWATAAVVAALEAAGGDEVTVAYDGSTWHATGPTGGGSVEEIGHGATLPGDGSTFNTFELEGNAVLPNGLYRWDDEASIWVQV